MTELGVDYQSLNDRELQEALESNYEFAEPDEKQIKRTIFLKKSQYKGFKKFAKFVSGFFVHQAFYWTCLWNKTPLKNYRVFIPAGMNPLTALLKKKMLMMPILVDDLAAGKPPEGKTWAELAEQKAKVLMTPCPVNFIQRNDGVYAVGTIMPPFPGVGDVNKATTKNLEKETHAEKREGL